MVSAPHYSLLASSADNVSESPTIRAKQKEEVSFASCASVACRVV